MIDSKGRALLCSRRLGAVRQPQKRKAGAELPHSIRSFTQRYCITKITKVKEKFAEKFMEKAPEINPRGA
jgi:hypothetical protein